MGSMGVEVYQQLFISLSITWTLSRVFVPLKRTLYREHIHRRTKASYEAEIDRITKANC